MNIETRTNEIMSSIKSVSKQTYRKSEVLPELFALQQEIVALTFNAEHAELGDLKIWDVESHLEQLNDDYGGIATEELQRFKSGCAFLCNLIKAECSGNRGENKAFYALERMRAEHLVLRNVELTDGNQRTEIDAVVITHKGVFIIEVKNTQRDIFIDEKGDYYRTGEYMRWDSNIGGKLTVKKDLLQKALCNAGLEKVEIFEIVVFTNNRIEVQNRCSRIKTCFLGQLPYLIDEWNLGRYLTSSDMSKASESIEKARCTEEYPLELDVERFKRDFAELMVKLESASQPEEGFPEITTAERSKRIRFLDILNTVFSVKNIRAAGTAAAFVITAVSVVANLNNNI